MVNRILVILFLMLFSIQQACATATVLPPPLSRFFDASGAPLAGGKVYTYQAGTTTPLASYTDSTATVQNTDPVILDQNGEAPIWISGAYKVVLEDSNNVVQWTVDNIQDFHTTDNILSTSTSSLAIANNVSKTFTTQSGKYFSPGIYVQATQTSNIANWMHGQVTSYSGTQLVIHVDSIGGSGTYADWTISLSGPTGPQGATGGTGGGGGDMVGANNLAVGAGGVANVATARANLGLGTAALIDTGTSANQVVKLDGSARLPAVDGSLLTNLPSGSTYTVTNSSNGKIIFGTVTIQWGIDNSTSDPRSISFGTSFSGTPYNVQVTNITSSVAYVEGVQSVTSSGFTVYQGNGGTPIYWFAIGPT